jgi:adenine-specific DNA-methyltransferase
MDLISFAQQIGSESTHQLSREEQKLWGQFMTPAAIARVMAARACAGMSTEKTIQLLEPAAGTGILAAAALQEVLSREQPPEHVYVHLFELDARLRPLLVRVANRMRRDGALRGVKVHVVIRIEDFLLSDVARDEPQFDLVIANPPYFKLKKSDERATRHAYAVHGQPNVYGLFMAACARVLKPEGRWCFITPRSWTNGPYFARARRQMLLHLHIDAIHVFESRQEHFTDDEVLQEAMITWATAKTGIADTVIVSSSTGIRDLGTSTLQTLPACEVMTGGTISLPTRRVGHDLRGFEGILASYGLKVSTGPVVAFRALEFISERPGRSRVPLLWMQHIQYMRVSWPIQKKREYIAANAETAWMMVPNASMVVLRRFSPKEDIRRVTAAPYLGGSLPGSVLGLENHTNYIYRPGGSMSTNEVKGLAAYLNSTYVDGYLRQTSGNTQVNATDLRNLPLPPLSKLTEMGSQLSKISSLSEADRVVSAVLGVAHKACVA